MKDSRLFTGWTTRKESDLCLYERPFLLIYREEPGLDFYFESELTAFLSETSVGLALTWGNIDSNSANPGKFIH